MAPASRNAFMVASCLSVAAALSLQFKRKYAAVVDREYVGHTGDDAHALYDRGLGFPSVSAVRNVESKQPGNTARAYVLGHITATKAMTASKPRTMYAAVAILAQYVGPPAGKPTIKRIGRAG
jgi:hypothetical protein